MKWNFFRELGRKAVHLTILALIAGYFIILSMYGKTYALMALILVLLVFLILEYIRLDLDIKIPFLDFFIRPKEIDRVYGAVYFIAASIICLAVFDFRIALAALLMTTFGDMSAAIIGQKFGHTMIFKKKTIIGGLMELFVNLLIGFIVLVNYTQINIYTILTMAFVATSVETLVENVDDNLAVPLFTGFVGQLLLMM
ncbi:CTP--2,3-di-O-geranylgeranyl-sn-glycero-1-phosphate cytidyltransferase [Candidatus Woesearchaeota archaeon]|nr:CTP--2,3-di-O-geranylgeranyl-sn-glycero-1-phosphate cytidyltransferase [Candidatus Woesearchaeota archaeon]